MVEFDGRLGEVTPRASARPMMILSCRHATAGLFMVTRRADGRNIISRLNRPLPWSFSLMRAWVSSSFALWLNFDVRRHGEACRRFTAALRAPAAIVDWNLQNSSTGQRAGCFPPSSRRDACAFDHLSDRRRWWPPRPSYGADLLPPVLRPPARNALRCHRPAAETDVVPSGNT